MKYEIKLLLVILIVGFTSCQKDENLSIESVNLTSTNTTKSFEIETTYTDQQTLETNLRWTSFLVSTAINKNQESRDQLTALLQNDNKVIRIDDLLISETPFYDAFYNSLVFYLNDGRPGNKNSPNPPPILPPGSAQDPVKFILFIQNYNCIELYFPNSLDILGYADDDGFISSTSTGHPLNDDNFNNGFFLFQQDSTIPLSDDETHTITHVEVNTGYIEENNNIIIARPYREPNEEEGSNEDRDCSYSEYSGIDFTDFLDN